MNGNVENTLEWGRDGLHVTSDDTLKTIRRPYMSPSTMQDVNQCPAKAAVRKMFTTTARPFDATSIGSATHTVLEQLYSPGNTPSDEVAARLTRELLHDQMNGQLTEDEKTLWTSQVLSNVLGNLAIEKRLKKSQAVFKTEFPLTNITLRGIPVHGIVDRIDIKDADRKTLTIIDYKTGKDKSGKNALKFGDPHGDQIRLYAMALPKHLETAGLGTYTISGGRLHYVTHATTRIVAVKNRQENGHTLDLLEQAWTTLNTGLDTGCFPARPSGLCGWCPLVTSCPFARTNTPSPRFNTDEILPAVPVREQADRPTRDSNEGTEEPSGTQEVGEMKQWRESKAWEGTHVDGHVNMASYAMLAAGQLSELAVKMLGETNAPFTKGDIGALTRTLAWIIMSAQHSITGTTDMDTSANARLRYHLFKVVEEQPAPLFIPIRRNDMQDHDRSPIETWEKWVDNVTKRIVFLVNTDMDLLDNPVTSSEAPWAKLAAK